MPSINVPFLNNYHDMEELYSRFSQVTNYTEPLKLECKDVSWVDASCTLAFVTLARLWFRWTGKETILCNVATDMCGYLSRLGLFDLQNVPLRLDKSYSALPPHGDTYHPTMIPPRFLPGHAEANHQAMDTALDHIERIIGQWFGEDKRLQRDVSYVLSELGENVQHSHSYAYLMLQRYKKSYTADGTRVVISIADLGIGIRQSLAAQALVSKNMTDSHCILRALEKGITGTGEQRGIGLNDVRHRVLDKAAHSSIRIRSGSGAVVLTPDNVETQDNLPDIPGVQVYLRIEGRQTLTGWV